MHTLIEDLRYGLRTLRKSPGFSVVAVVILSLGIGANAAVFSVVNAVLLESLPLDEPERVVALWEYDRIRGTDREGTSQPDLEDLRQQTRSFEHLEAYSPITLTLASEDDPERLAAARVSADYFEALGVAPMVGRGFEPADQQRGGAPVVALSEGLWRRRFASDPAVVGRTMRLDSTGYTVIGVMPSDAEALFGPRDLWVPLVYSQNEHFRGVHILWVAGRLQRSVSLDAAQADVDAVMAHLEQDYADDNLGRGARLIPAREQVVGNVQPILFSLLAAVGFVLLITCANVANLLLARATVRQREIAVRAALGAGRWRIVRQLLTESLVLTAVAAFGALAFAMWGLDVLIDMAPENTPRLDHIALDSATVLFGLGAALVTWFLFALTPAIRLSRANLSEALHASMRGSSAAPKERRLRQAFVVVEAALAVLLLAGTGLLIRSFWNLLQVDPGYDGSNVLMAKVTLPESRYPFPASWPFLRWPEVVQFQDEIASRVEKLPGVESVAVAMNRPVEAGWTTRVAIEGQPEVPIGELDEAYFRPVGAGYFRTLRIPLLRGRSFEEQDDSGHPLVAIVNEAFVRRHLPGEEPLGRKVLMYGAPREIVGVVRDVKFRGPTEPALQTVYLPFRQNPMPDCSLVIRTTVEPENLAVAVRREIHSADPELAAYGVASIEEATAASLAFRRFLMTVSTVFAGMALLLASAGLFGVVSYSVSQRRQEFGVRMALGAGRAQVLRLVLRQGLMLSAVGVAFGLIAATGLTQLLRSQLYAVEPADPLTYGLVAGVFVLVSLLASYEPARRATNLSPVEALRNE